MAATALAPHKSLSGLPHRPRAAVGNKCWLAGAVEMPVHTTMSPGLPLCGLEVLGWPGLLKGGFCRLSSLIKDFPKVDLEVTVPNGRDSLSESKGRFSAE